MLLVFVIDYCVCFHIDHYERLKLQLSKQYILDNMTGLLLIYPSCVLHVIEVSVTVIFLNRNN